MSEKRIEAILIGGSAGSFESFARLVRAATGSDTPPIVGVFHLMRNVESHVTELLKFRTGKEQIAEAEEKEPLQTGWIYLAPSNYHLLIEEDRTFCLDSSDLVEFSRPSIDVTFESAAQVFGAGLAGILLSGSNADGTFGMQCIERKGGMAMVLDPEEAEFQTMPLSCIQGLENPRIYTLSRIEAFLSRPHHE